MSYQIFETGNFARETRKTFDAGQQKLIAGKLNQQVYPQLRQEPHFGRQIKKLKDYSPETWRYRIGKVRFFYYLDESKKRVIMSSVRWRKEAYR